MSERLATYVHGSPELIGVPSKRLIYVYDKFGHGAFGLICTGNIMVSPVRAVSVEISKPKMIL